MNKKTPICPYCKRELKFLEYHERVERKRFFEKKNGYFVFTSHKERNPDRITMQKFGCPYCKRVLTDDVGKAQEFLE